MDTIHNTALTESAHVTPGLPHSNSRGRRRLGGGKAWSSSASPDHQSDIKQVFYAYPAYPYYGYAYRRVGLRLVVGQQIIFPKNLEQRASELSLIVVTHVVTPHWLSIPIRS